MLMTIAIAGAGFVVGVVGDLSLTGWPGKTWQMGDSGEYFIDRNGDGNPDIEVQFGPDSNGNIVELVNYGDGAGFVPYRASTYLPPPPRPGTWDPYSH